MTKLKKKNTEVEILGKFHSSRIKMKKIVLLCIIALFYDFIELHAQRDIDYFLSGNSYEKILALYGEPLESREYDGEEGEYIETLYDGFQVTFSKDSKRIEMIIVWDNEFCFLPSVVPGGIKIGDRKSKFDGMDFSLFLSGEHYEDNGFIPLDEPYQSTCTDNIFNYKILSRGKPYCLNFAVQQGIVREIVLYFLTDYTVA